MGKNYFLAFFTVLVMLVAPANIRAQTPGSEADVIKNANTAFTKEDYPAALPLYSQLLSTYPNDPNYNYRFGVCMLFASADKGKALPFLEEASKNPKCEIDVWFYLGRAYHLNYRFDEAIVAFNKYKTLAGEKKAEKMQVDNQIAMCKTGKKLLKAVTDITVLEKKELPLADFFRSYNLEGYSGQLLVKGDEFKTNLDRKKNETSIIFLSSEKNTLYFSSYGDDESNGKDIYRVVRLPTGGWSKPYNVGYPINTEYDEDYPFLHPNGKVLYFSSKGHNSMGGYDIFRSELNEETGSWLKPSNMDFAINSPDDDILFVTDMEEKTAWFASARNSPQGFMTVYHVVIERKPVNSCIISGTFKPTGVDPTANAKITVRNEETNQPVGVYNSNSSTGKYLINLPNTGGKYTFTVEKSGIHTQTKAVFIPPQYELKPIRQEIFYTESGGEQNLNVVTYFDEDTASFAPDFLRDKANLDVNPDDYQHYEVVDLGDPANPGNPRNPGNADASSGDPVDGNDSSDIPGGGTDPASEVPSSQGTVTTAELIESAFENADATKQEAVATHQQANRAFTHAAGLNKQAKDKQAEADKAKATADAMPEGPEKEQAKADAARLQGEANALQSQTVAAFNVANGLNEDANHKDSEAKVAAEYAQALEDGSKRTGPGAMDAANTKEQELNDISNVRSQAEETAKNAQEQADQKRENMQIVKNQLADLNEEKQANQDILKQMRADSAKEKDPDLREGYATQIQDVQESIAENDRDIAKKEAQLNRMTNELNDLDNQAAAAKGTIEASKDPSVAPVAMTPEEKKQLSENVVSYQNRVEDSNNPTVYAPVTQTPVVTQDPGTQTPVPSVVEGPETQQSVENASVAIADVQGDVQDKIDQAGNESDPVKREQLIGDAHRDAEKDLNTRIADAQNALQNEKDPQRQQALKNKIAQLNTERNRQHDLAIASDQRVKDAQGVATQDPGTQTPETQQPVENASVVIADVQSEVQDKIDQAGNESDPVKREQLIGDAHRDAEKDLNTQIADAQNALQNEKDPQRQQALKNKIAQLNTERNRQHDLAIASDQRVKDAQGVATQDPGTQTPETQQPVENASVVIADVQGDVQDKIDQAGNESDPVKREQLIGDAHRDAEQQLDTQIADAQNDLQNEKDPQRLEAIKNNIAQLKTERDKQHDLAIASDQRVKDAQGVATQDPGTQTPETQQPVADAADVIADVQGSVNDKIQEAESETDPVKREQLIGDAHRDAEQQLDTRIADAQQDLATEKDPQRLEAIKNNIAQLTTERNRQHDLAIASDQRVEDSQSTATADVQEDPFTPYITGIADADTISDPAVREAKKAEVYTDWATRLESKIADDKRLLGTTKDKSAKDSLKLLIAGEEQQLKDLRQDAKEAKTAEQAAIAQQNSPGAKSDRAFDEQITATASTPDVADREDAKEAIYTTWADSLDNEATKLEGIATKERNAKKKAELNQQVQALRTSVGEKRELADAAHVAANNARTGSEPVVQNPETQTPGTNPETQSPTAVVTPGNVVVEDNVTFTDPEAQSALKERDDLKDEAQVFRAKQDSLIAAAGQASGEDKTELLADATDAQRNAWAKEAEASDKQGQANEEQFRTNSAVLDSYKNGSGATNPDKVEQASLVNDEALVLLQRARDKRKEAKLASSPYQRSQALAEAEDLEQQALVKQQTALSIYKEAGVQPSAVAQNPTTQTPENQNPVTQTPENQNPGTQNPVTQTVIPGVVEGPVTQPVDPSNQSRVASQLKPGETFKITSQPNTQPIPVDPPVPSGIVYKVQIGAFRNPIPVDLFKGIQPLTAESVGNGITRYTAGQFVDFNNADAAKREIRAMGYPDAFVVAYKDGKRISIAEARNMQGGNNQPVVQNPVNTQTPNTQTPNTQSPETQTPVPGVVADPNTQNPTAGTVIPSVVEGQAPATDVKTTKELFYTVQVGVYSRPVSSAKLFNLTGLFSERTPNGYIRYATGKYNNLQAATDAKNNIVNIGVKDAFVTAYFEGQRISVERAAELERQGVVPAGSGTPNTQQPVPSVVEGPQTQTPTQTPAQPQTQEPVAPTWEPDQQPVTQPVTQPVAQPTNPPQDMTPIPVIANTKPNIPDTGIVFCVQLGAYQQFVPIAMANRFLLFASKGVSIYRDANSGLTVYQVGVYGNYKEANALKEDAVSKGITDAFIVAWKDGEKITMEEALKLRPGN